MNQYKQKITPRGNLVKTIFPTDFSDFAFQKQKAHDGRHGLREKVKSDWGQRFFLI